jgi:hypothetical protein
LACCKVGRYGASGAARSTVPHYDSCQSWPPARAASWIVCMAWGIGAHTSSQGSLCVEVVPHLCGSCLGRRRKLLVRTGRSSEARRRLVVRDGDSSCETETPRARRRLLVRDRDFSCEVEACRRSLPLVGDLSRKLLTGRRQDVLTMMTLIRILSPRLLNLGLHNVMMSEDST